MDKRIDEARALATGLPAIVGKVVSDLADYAEERLRVNTGLVGENAALRAKLRSPEFIDLSMVSSTDLLAELSRRV